VAAIYGEFIEFLTTQYNGQSLHLAPYFDLKCLSTQFRAFLPSEVGPQYLRLGCDNLAERP
jgi:hypothetical protein